MKATVNELGQNGKYFLYKSELSRKVNGVIPFYTNKYKVVFNLGDRILFNISRKSIKIVEKNLLIKTREELTQFFISCYKNKFINYDLIEFKSLISRSLGL